MQYIDQKLLLIQILLGLSVIFTQKVACFSPVLSMQNGILLKLTVTDKARVFNLYTYCNIFVPASTVSDWQSPSPPGGPDRIIHQLNYSTNNFCLLQ